MDRSEQTLPITDCLAVVGSTASGKSALALTLAKTLDGEIVSVDSMQVYRGMDIGTAKPTADERSAVRHHMIDVCAPEVSYSSAEYAAAALLCVRDILSRGKTPILCGGTGLYLDALMRGEAPAATDSDAAVRARLFAEYERLGAAAMHEKLRVVDPESADAIHENNVKRVLRALEVYEVSGKPKSVWDAESRERTPVLSPTVIGLTYHHRETLYRRIETRVDEMLQSGLWEEVERLDAAGVFETNGTAAAAIGYKELLPALHGACSREAAAEQLKIATRRYAKRQITWFSAKPYVRFIFCDTEDGAMRSPEEIAGEALSLYQK